ncbi:MAG: phosphatidate cytidylyltransferase [Chitinophagales bacterium]
MSAPAAGSGLLPRVITAVLGIPFLLWLLWVGGTPLFFIVEVAAALMLWEFHRLVTAGGRGPHLVLLLLAGLGVATAIGREEPGLATGALFAALALEAVRGLFQSQDGTLLRRAGALVMGALYIGYPVGVLLRLRAVSFWWLGGAFVLTWTNDILAYLVGVSAGRRRLAPQISPKKSVEGAVGGLAGTVLAATLIRGWFGFDLAGAALTGAVCSAAGVLGDLIESALKREAGVKDSGRLLPGHGGLLDRFDSAFLILPVLYLLRGIVR